MPVLTEISPEMRIRSVTGERLYLDKDESARFLQAAKDEAGIERMFCLVLHDTGCRPSEALELSAARFDFNGAITFRTLKKRKQDQKGRTKLPHYRTVQVSRQTIDSIDLVFGLRQRLKKENTANALLWSMSRTTAYRLIKRVMHSAKVKGPQATSKGLRHAYGIKMLTAKAPVPLHLLAKAMGHSSSKITEIYLNATGKEERNLFLAAMDGE